eukprot:scaffold220697_cov32-Tisochrysis_lutea.AAC.1
MQLFHLLRGILGDRPATWEDRKEMKSSLELVAVMRNYVNLDDAPCQIAQTVRTALLGGVGR